MGRFGVYERWILNMKICSATLLPSTPPPTPPTLARSRSLALSLCNFTNIRIQRKWEKRETRERERANWLHMKMICTIQFPKKYVPADETSSLSELDHRLNRKVQALKEVCKGMYVGGSGLGCAVEKEYVLSRRHPTSFMCMCGFANIEWKLNTSSTLKPPHPLGRLSANCRLWHLTSRMRRKLSTFAEAIMRWHAHIHTQMHAWMNASYLNVFERTCIHSCPFPYFVKCVFWHEKTY